MKRKSFILRSASPLGLLPLSKTHCVFFIISLLATLVAQAQTYRIDSQFSDAVHALVVDSKAPVHLFCTAPEGRQSLTLMTYEPDYQFNPVAAIKDSMLTIAFPHAEGAIALTLSHLPAYIVVRPGSQLVIDSLDNYTAFSHRTSHIFRVEERAELYMLPHFAPLNFHLDVLPHGRILFPQGLDGGNVFNLMDSSYFEANPEHSEIDRHVVLYEGTGREGTPIKSRQVRQQPFDNSIVAEPWYTEHHNVFPANNQLQVFLNAGLTAGLQSRSAALSPYGLGMGLMAEVRMLWHANWDRRYYDGFTQNGQSVYRRHRTWAGLAYGLEFLPFANQVVRTDDGDIRFTDNPTAVPSTPNGGSGTRPLLFNTYLSLPLIYAYTNDRKSGFTIGLYPGINLRSIMGAIRTNGFNAIGMASPEDSPLSVMNPYRLDASFTFAIGGTRWIPNFRFGLLPTFTTSDGKGVHTMTLTWQL